MFYFFLAIFLSSLKATAQEAPMPAKIIYGLLDPALALKVLKKESVPRPTLKGLLLQNLIQLREQQHKLRVKQQHVKSNALGILAAQIWHYLERLQEHSIVGTTS